MGLGHEQGFGAPCLKCKENCEGFELHFWRWALESIVFFHSPAAPLPGQGPWAVFSSSLTSSWAQALGCWASLFLEVNEKWTPLCSHHEGGLLGMWSWLTSVLSFRFPVPPQIQTVPFWVAEEFVVTLLDCQLACDEQWTPRAHTYCCAAVSMHVLLRVHILGAKKPGCNSSPYWTPFNSYLHVSGYKRN